MAKGWPRPAPKGRVPKTSFMDRLKSKPKEPKSSKVLKSETKRTKTSYTKDW
jgi:hypothetical protein